MTAEDFIDIIKIKVLPKLSTILLSYQNDVEKDFLYLKSKIPFYG